MRLSSLAKLEKIELEKESKELENKIKDLKIILINENRQKDILKSRLADLVKKYIEMPAAQSLLILKLNQKIKLLKKLFQRRCCCHFNSDRKY